MLNPGINGFFKPKLSLIALPLVFFSIKTFHKMYFNNMSLKYFVACLSPTIRTHPVILP